MPAAPQPIRLVDLRQRALAFITEQVLEEPVWILDQAIPIGRWRVGVDPILGLLPGAGDWIGALLSVYVLYEGARLGTPVRGNRTQEGA